MDIYVSSACISESDLWSNLASLSDAGFKAIELTGGIAYQADVVPSITDYLSVPGRSFQFHNYSPCPEEHFVLNLASLDQDTYNRSLSHAQRTLGLTRQLGLSRYAVHAGFYIPVRTQELGKRISKRELYDRDKCMQKFVDTLKQLYQEYPDELYIENNVVSAANYEEYNENPFMLTCAKEYFELKEQLPAMKLLLDLAHLKVSCKTLGLDFPEEARILCQETDYIHISDNDGYADTNQGVIPGSDMADLLGELPLASKVVTLEVYSGLQDVNTTYQIIQSFTE